MFGGAGIWRNGVMFALVSGEEIFLKSDEASRPRFREAGCRPFMYEKDGKPVELSYWSIPEAALDDGELLREWADLAYCAAVAAKRPDRRKRS
jgi:DNA transformation protein